MCICARIRGKSRVHTAKKISTGGDEADSHAHRTIRRLWECAARRFASRAHGVNVKESEARAARYSLSLYNMRNELCADRTTDISFTMLSFIAYFYYILLLCVSTASPIAILMALLHR